MNTRRQFLLRAPLGVLVAATACRKQPPATFAIDASHTPALRPRAAREPAPARRDTGDIR